MADVKRVYTFGNKEAEGNGKMRELLGGKGANLAEMNLIGIPVPPGFTITTEVCSEYYAHGKEAVIQMLRPEVEKAMKNIEKLTGHEIRRQGDAAAGVGTLGSPRFDARHDGHDPQPGYERPGRGGRRQAYGQPPFRMGLVPPFRTDVRRRGAGHETRIERRPRPVRGTSSRSRSTSAA